MKYNELDIDKYRDIKRVGRGIAAGQGKTAGRGTKGQGARTGHKLRPGFAGGQTPLMQQLPKLPGFHSHKQPAEVIYTGQLDKLTGKTVDTEALAKANLITSPYVRVKLLVRGELKKAHAVKLNFASQSAKAALEAAGGSFEAVAQLGRPKIRTSKSEK